MLRILPNLFAYRNLSVFILARKGTKTEPLNPGISPFQFIAFFFPPPTSHLIWNIFVASHNKHAMLWGFLRKMSSKTKSGSKNTAALDRKNPSASGKIYHLYLIENIKGINVG